VQTAKASVRAVLASKPGLSGDTEQSSGGFGGINPPCTVLSLCTRNKQLYCVYCEYDVSLRLVTQLKCYVNYVQTSNQLFLGGLVLCITTSIIFMYINVYQKMKYLKGFISVSS